MTGETMACLAKHEHGGHSSIDRNLHKWLGGLRINHFIGNVFWKDAIKAIVDVRDERCFQVCLKLAIVQHHLIGIWFPGYHRKRIVLRTNLLLLLRQRSLAQKDLQSSPCPFLLLLLLLGCQKQFMAWVGTKSETYLKLYWIKVRGLRT